MKVIVFSKPMCSACDMLKAFLELHKIEYKTINGATAEGQTTMRTNGVFPLYYPALCVDGRLYEYAAMFGERGELLRDDLRRIFGVER